MRVIVKPLVRQKLDQLLLALMEKDYFNDESNALAYLHGIRNFIDTIPAKTHRKTKDFSYGNYYATYKANRHTTWYIIFDTADDVYLIKNIINNHTPDYPRFIASLK